MANFFLIKLLTLSLLAFLKKTALKMILLRFLIY